MYCFVSLWTPVFLYLLYVFSNVYLEVFNLKALMCYLIQACWIYIYIPLREFISDVVTSRGNRRFPLTNLLAQIRGVT
jgi:hypothetical protein